MRNFKKDFEVLFYLLIEIGLAILVKELADLSPELTVIIGALFVFYGKKLMTLIKS